MYGDEERKEESHAKKCSDDTCSIDAKKAAVNTTGSTNKVEKVDMCEIDKCMKGDGHEIEISFLDDVDYAKNGEAVDIVHPDIEESNVTAISNHEQNVLTKSVPHATNQDANATGNRPTNPRTNGNRPANPNRKSNRNTKINSTQSAPNISSTTNTSNGNVSGTPTRSSKPSDSEKYPQDCYSFLVLYGPKEPQLFLFGLFPWMFQMIFLLLILIGEMSRLSGTIGETDNPDGGYESPLNMLAHFIPSKANLIVRFSQVVSLIAYLAFPQASMQDVVTAIRLFPIYELCQMDPIMVRMAISCLLRLVQGILAIFATLVLVMTSTDVLATVLIFTAMDFISELDDRAFKLAKTGNLGPSLQEKVNEVVKTDLPTYKRRIDKYAYYKIVVGTVSVILMGMVLVVICLQYNSNQWMTRTLRVQFQDDLREYSGCFEINDKEQELGRHIYNSLENATHDSSFGYCRAKRQWILFKGNNSDMHQCDAEKNELELARSSKTDTFDISTSYSQSWVTSGNSPLDLFFFKSRKGINLHCDLSLGDGRCDHPHFNKLGYQYDGGDCCASTCKGSRCGRGALANVFGSNTSGDGFRHCKNNRMIPIIIRLNDIASSRSPKHFEYEEVPWDTEIVTGEIEWKEEYYSETPVNPLFTVECDGKSVLAVYIDQSMRYGEETMMVEDGAKCTVTVQSTSLDAPIWWVSYTIYHGSENKIEIFTRQIERNYRNVTNFVSIPKCFFTKLGEHTDTKSIYTASEPSNKAIRWLLEDDSEVSRCEHDDFLERYALVKIHYSMNPTTSFIHRSKHCAWPSIKCDGSKVTTVKFRDASLRGNIPSDILLLKDLQELQIYGDQVGSLFTYLEVMPNLQKLDLDDVNMTTIPSEIWSLTNLQSLSLKANQIKHLPSEIGNMTMLEELDLDSNEIGSLPAEFARLTRLIDLSLRYNNLSYLPPEIWFLTKLRNLDLHENNIASLPTEVGFLQRLEYLYVDGNPLTSFPEEIEHLKSLKYLELFRGWGNDGNVNCGWHSSDTCKNCGYRPNLCGGDCTWNAVASICTETPVPGDLPVDYQTLIPCLNESPFGTKQRYDCFVPLGVRCGAYYKRNCQECTFGRNIEDQGSDLCGGECQWVSSDECVASGCVDGSTDDGCVSCGGHRRKSCKECLNAGQAGRWEYCNGQCRWDSDEYECVDRHESQQPISESYATVNCGGHYTATCNDCSLGPNGENLGESFCHGECKWDDELKSCNAVASASSGKQEVQTSVNSTAATDNARTEPDKQEPQVNCGGHDAANCEMCPFDDAGSSRGSSWCNGDCTWDTLLNACIQTGNSTAFPTNNANPTSEDHTTVDCGGHDATTCNECPFEANGHSHGSSWCNGECKWDLELDSCVTGNARTASVHLWFDTPTEISKPAWWFQQVVPRASADATYFATNTHRYGYGGIQQVNATTGRVIFSIWDQGGCDQDVTDCDSDDIAETVACGEGVTCTDFGGEGTGRKSYFDIHGEGFPVVDTAYYFVTQASYLGNRRMEHTGYFYQKGAWKLVSRIRVSTNLNEEWWLAGLYSFIEQWLPIETNQDRAALYGPSFVAETDGFNWFQIGSAKFSHGTAENHDRVNAWQEGAEDGFAVGIETGGSAEPEATTGATFSYPDVIPSDEMVAFQAIIPCLNDALTRYEIECCLGKSELCGLEEPVVKDTFEQISDGPVDEEAINCGSHWRSSCEECPFDDNGVDHESAWCNGDCAWISGACVAISADDSGEPIVEETLAVEEALEETSDGPVDEEAISCGSHKRTSCEECPIDGDQNHGSAWCNGDCAWDANSEKCVLATDILATDTMISCGNHKRASCEECPLDGNQNHGSTWCNGECSWDADTETCVLPASEESSSHAETHGVIEALAIGGGRRLLRSGGRRTLDGGEDFDPP